MVVLLVSFEIREHRRNMRMIAHEMKMPEGFGWSSKRGESRNSHCSNICQGDNTHPDPQPIILFITRFLDTYASSKDFEAANMTSHPPICLWYLKTGTRVTGIVRSEIPPAGIDLHCHLRDRDIAEDTATSNITVNLKWLLCLLSALSLTTPTFTTSSSGLLL